jgi:hypothetical protein
LAWLTTTTTTQGGESTRADDTTETGVGEEPPSDVVVTGQLFRDCEGKHWTATGRVVEGELSLTAVRGHAGITLTLRQLEERMTSVPEDECTASQACELERLASQDAAAFGQTTHVMEEVPVEEIAEADVVGWVGEDSGWQRWLCGWLVCCMVRWLV